MPEDLSNNIDQKIEAPQPQQSNKLFIGLDVGTMNLVCARSDQSGDIKLTRNVFLPIDDEISDSDFSELSHVEDSEGKIYVIGQDAFNFSNVFGQEVRRPMKRGVISSDEVDAIEILTLVIKNLIGDISGKQAFCTYSIPAESIDSGRSITYHEKVFGRILNAIGVNNTPLNEAMAIIYSECQQERFSGIGISFGAGMVNCAISYKGIETLKFSIEQSGDWIDQNVADSLNMVPNRVTNIKEKYFDMVTGFTHQKNKKVRRVLEAIEYYYSTMIATVVKKIITEFEEKVDLDLDDSLPVVISGGTSLPNGFIEAFKSEFEKNELPFELSEIRRAKNPLTAVANGLMIKTMASSK